MILPSIFIESTFGHIIAAVGNGLNIDNCVAVQDNGIRVNSNTQWIKLENFDLNDGRFRWHAACIPYNDFARPRASDIRIKKERSSLLTIAQPLICIIPITTTYKRCQFDDISKAHFRIIAVHFERRRLLCNIEREVGGEPTPIACRDVFNFHLHQLGSFNNTIDCCRQLKFNDAHVRRKNDRIWQGKQCSIRLGLTVVYAIGGNAITVIDVNHLLYV